ncbi:hypothetical protein MGN01_33210 [Methylobacterium gnaphalii]|uniref:Uncharacterized protein n=1 Tax=Methylobacterium gnaphalii TaxID=1010610 RepID=A0A512JNE5_9HYPH|nr:hypothetical protein MGN01_33210 [Methylobacterium gnaphalii]GLS49480.1 hypothetical protein GCM10007885_23290 [Methylobacterium gnaphalii]
MLDDLSEQESATRLLELGAQIRVPDLIDLLLEPRHSRSAIPVPATLPHQSTEAGWGWQRMSHDS